MKVPDDFVELTKKESDTLFREMSRNGKAPGLAGLDSTRDNIYKEGHYNMFHAPTESKLILSKMEANGEATKNPKMFATAKYKHKKIMEKEHTFKHMNYDKEGAHPLDFRKGNLESV